jgi:demethylmenaquinone methyltransferase/2-methoxy-6-polyprenyl-1,4-benzoquinol methylase
MKILESRPKRYDRGIALLSLGASESARKRLVNENVKPNSRVLEIGCGTGTMAILAARRGAQVLGFDISGSMLQIAREKVEAAGFSDRIELAEMGVSGMENLDGNSYDLVMSMLVFSELSRDEQVYALKHAYRTLKPGGKLAIADEAIPEGFVKRLIHLVVRIPLAFLVFILTQTTTRAVTDLNDLVSQAGFVIDTEARSHLDSFIYLVAIKE